MATIVGYIHVCQKGAWQRSFALLVNAIKAHGLYERAASVRLGVVSDAGTANADPILSDPKFEIVHTGRATEYERPTLLCMKKMAATDPEDTLYFYLHTKGITHFGTEREQNVIDWINLMLYWNVEHWQLAVNKLRTYDTYGCNDTGFHYSGNFWWARKHHVAKLPATIGSDYIAPENWVQRVPHKKCNIYSSGHQGCGHYHAAFPRECYENEISRFLPLTDVY